jgi:Fe-S cluster assembly protein SufD
MTDTHQHKRQDSGNALPIAALQDQLASEKAVAESADSTSPFWPVREHALNALAKQGLPNGKKQERWKYSPLHKVWQDHYFAQYLSAHSTASTSDTQTAEQLCASEDLPKNAIVLPLQSGRCRAADLAYLSEIPGFKLQRAAALADETLKARAEAELASLASADGLCAATVSLAPEALVITLTNDFDAKRPLVIWHSKAKHSQAELAEAAASMTPSADYTTVMVRLERGQQLTLIERYEAQATQCGLKTVVTLLDLAPESNCEHLRLLSGQSTVQQHFYTRVLLDAHSQYHGGTYSIGEGFIRSVIEPQLKAAGAQCNINGAYLTCGQAHHDQRIFVDHFAPHCNSNSFVKGIAGQGGTAVFNGRIHIAPGAKQSDGALQNRNLLLDNSSAIHTKPELEIYNDDVKCSHGATVSQLDHQQLLYLQSRGLDQPAAVNLLLESYLLETLNGLPPSFTQTDALKQWLLDALLRVTAKQAENDTPRLPKQTKEEAPA